MFVNISPKSSDFNQTICSLRFAEKVKDCKIKKWYKTLDTNDIC